MMFNYGAFPQTWEDPNEVSPHTLHKGDNDPIDAIELGGRSWPTGSIVEVRRCCVWGTYRATGLVPCYPTSAISFVVVASTTVVVSMTGVVGDR